MGLERLFIACFKSNNINSGLSSVVRKDPQPGNESAREFSGLGNLPLNETCNAEQTSLAGGNSSSGLACCGSSDSKRQSAALLLGALSSKRLAAQNLKASADPQSTDSPAEVSATRSSLAATAAAAATSTNSQRLDAAITHDLLPYTDYGAGGPVPHYPPHPDDLYGNAHRAGSGEARQQQHPQQQRQPLFVADLGRAAAAEDAAGGTTTVTLLTSSVLPSTPGTPTPASTRETPHVGATTSPLTPYGTTPHVGATTSPLTPYGTTPAPSSPLSSASALHTLRSPPLYSSTPAPISHQQPNQQPDQRHSTAPLGIASGGGGGGTHTRVLVIAQGRKPATGVLDRWCNQCDREAPWSLAQGAGSISGLCRTEPGTGPPGHGARATLGDMPGLDLHPSAASARTAATTSTTTVCGGGGGGASETSMADDSGGLRATPPLLLLQGVGNGGGGSTAADAAGGAERCELQLIRVSSLSELSCQIEGLRWLASGSSGRVFTGLWKGSSVAVKVVLSTTPAQLRQSSREALLSRAVSHPAICQCYTVCSECILPQHLQIQPAPRTARTTGTSLATPGDVRAVSAASCVPPCGSLALVVNSSGGDNGWGASGGGGCQNDRTSSQTINASSASELAPRGAATARYRNKAEAAAAVAAIGGGRGGAIETAAAAVCGLPLSGFVREGFLAAAAAAEALPLEGRSASVASPAATPLAAAAAGSGCPGSMPGTPPALSSRSGFLPGRGCGSNSGAGSRMAVALALSAACGVAGRVSAAAAVVPGIVAAAAGMTSPPNSSGGGGGGTAPVSSLSGWGSGPCSQPSATVQSAAASTASAAAGREARRCLAAAATELNTTLSLSELLRSYTPADEETNLAMHSLPAVLLSMGALPGRYCTIVVLEWCDQGTLLQSIRARPFNAERTFENHEGLLVLLRTALEVAQGMRYLHSLDIVHGDLKPSNLLLQSHAPAVGGGSGIWAADTRGYVAKVADFGLAMPADPSSSGGVLGGDAAAGPVLGCNGGGGELHWGALAYLAPEVPEHGPSKKSDVYSYGCVLYHMCTGKQPFQTRGACWWSRSTPLPVKPSHHKPGRLPGERPGQSGQASSDQSRPD